MIIIYISLCLLDAGVKKGAGVPVSHQLSELLQVMIAYDHLPLEGLAAGGVRLLLQLVMQGPAAPDNLRPLLGVPLVPQPPPPQGSAGEHLTCGLPC